MQKPTASKRHFRNSHDLYSDLQKIKDAFSLTASDATYKASEFLTDSLDSIKEKSSKLQENVSNYTAEKPIKSLGIVFLAGIAIGYLVHRK